MIGTCECGSSAGQQSIETKAQGKKEKQNEQNFSDTGRIEWPDTREIGASGRRQERESEIHMFEDRIAYFFQIRLKISTQISKIFSGSKQDKHKAAAIFTVVTVLPTEGNKSLERSQKANWCVACRRAGASLWTSSSSSAGCLPR